MSMYRDPAFQEPFEALQQKELLALGRLLGRRSLQAKWGFLALLPEIERRQAFRQEGFVSVHEYAARKGGASHREVQEILHLHTQIGQFWVLWRLLAMGAVGLSKFQRVASWVTAENADWWAEQLVKCTRSQLDALIARLTRAKAEADNRDKRTQEAPGPASAVGPASVGAHESAAALASGGSSAESAVIKVFMSRYGAKALRDLHELAVRAEGPISLGKLIERLVLDALARNSVPAGPGRPEPGAAGIPDGEPSLGQPPEGEPARLALPPRRVLQVVYRNLDTGMTWIPSAAGELPVEEAPLAERERIDQAPPVYFAELRARALAARVRHARAIAAKVKAGESLASDDGRHIPVAIEVYLLARSGGLCEIDGCSKRVDQIHHCDVYSEHHGHDPDRMLAICTPCHDEIHGELVVPDRIDPRILHPVEPGKPLHRSRVGEAVLAAKAAS